MNNHKKTKAISKTDDKMVTIFDGGVVQSKSHEISQKNEPMSPPLTVIIFWISWSRMGNKNKGENIEDCEEVVYVDLGGEDKKTISIDELDLISWKLST